MVLQQTKPPYQFECSTCNAPKADSLDGLCACGSRTKGGVDQKIRCVTLTPNKWRTKTPAPRPLVGIVEVDTADEPHPTVTVPLSPRVRFLAMQQRLF
jgi:hypothetical protein